MRADGEDMAQQARLNPLGDALESIVVPEHIAHLDGQIALRGQRYDSLPLRPACTRGLIVPDMFADLDHLLSLVEALVVAALRGDRYDPLIIEYLASIAEPMHTPVGSTGALQLLAPLWVGLEDAGDIHARVPMECRKLASRMAVLCAILSDPNQCHRQIPVLEEF